MSWKNKLEIYLFHPENYDSIVMKFTDEFVIINDKFPKAKYHYLMMPRKKVSSSISKLEGTADLQMLLQMRLLSTQFLKEKNHNFDEFRIGFHAVPSMDQLHLHIISDDFVSPCLKTKKHWRSFTTDFFRPLDSVIKSLEETGFISINTDLEEAKLKGNLACHKCAKVIANIPSLKTHLLSHHQQ